LLLPLFGEQRDDCLPPLVGRGFEKATITVDIITPNADPRRIPSAGSTERVTIATQIGRCS
jgi:hypothetical protein